MGGKSPSEEYNIECQNYFEQIESSLSDIMAEKFAELSECASLGDFKVEGHGEITSYLLDESGDELVKRPFLLSAVSQAKDCELEEDGSQTTDKPKSESKGFFAKLFSK